MEHRYTRDDCPRPEYDEKLTTWLKGKENMYPGMSYPIALYHEGYIYRMILAEGLGEYVSACEYLKKLGLVNLLADDQTFRGYDAVFATVPVKVSMHKHEFSLNDIPRNKPAK
ncbi:hypothetical protein AB5B87_003218 [Providencia rettgeri]|nr:hypothetical protein [Providencia rettgeri]